MEDRAERAEIIPTVEGVFSFSDSVLPVGFTGGNAENPVTLDLDRLLSLRGGDLDLDLSLIREGGGGGDLDLDLSLVRRAGDRLLKRGRGGDLDLPLAPKSLKASAPNRTRSLSRYLLSLLLSSLLLLLLLLLLIQVLLSDRSLLLLRLRPRPCLCPQSGKHSRSEKSSRES